MQVNRAGAAKTETGGRKQEQEVTGTVYKETGTGGKGTEEGARRRQQEARKQIKDTS